MKKGFTMIELIFVIVILGILATVAIPRLAGTTTDAEISAAAANIRTLISDAAAYYAVKDGFVTGDTSTKWNEITNVPLKLQKAGGTATTTDGIIKIGGKDCIRLRIQNGDDNIPAHILVAKDSKNKNSGACKQVLASAPLKAYFDSRVDGVNNLGTDRGAIPIGSIAEELVAPAPVAVASAAPTPAPAPAPKPAPVAAPARPAPAVATATPPPPPAAPPVAAPVATPPAATPPAATPPAATPAAATPAPAPFIPFVCNNCTQAWGLMNSFSAAAGGPHLPARPQYFSTATNGGQVTQGTGTGSIGLAIPSWLFNNLLRR